MPVTLADKMAKLSAGERAKVKRRSAQLIAEEMTLQQIRKKLKRRQIDVADLLGIGQDSVSRMEKRNDAAISTVKRYVEALGGTFEMYATLPGQEHPVRIVAPKEAA